MLSFDPEGARRMLAKAGFEDGIGPDGRRLSVEISVNTAPDGQLIAQILQQQWRRHLGIDATVATQELKAWLHTIFSKAYKGVAFFLALGRYVDPTSFLNRFTTGADALGTGWTDPKCDAMLSQANGRPEDSDRMQALSQCEAHLLGSMPFIPLYRWAWCRLEKPYVRGRETNIMDVRRFKYAWIDTRWRAS